MIAMSVFELCRLRTVMLNYTQLNQLRLLLCPFKKCSGDLEIYIYPTA